MRNRLVAFSIAAAAIAAAACGSDTATSVPVASISVSFAKQAVLVGATTQATATVSDASAKPLTDRVVAWSSTNTAIASVDASSGLVTGVAPGTASITATSQGKTGSATITVASKTVDFTASMSPAGEIGATLAGNPSGAGGFTASLDTTTNVFTWSFTFQGLTSNVNNGHIHGPYVLGSGNSAGVILNFNPATPPPGGIGLTFTGFGTATSGSGGGSIVLAGSTIIGNAVSADSLKKLLLAGNAYVNIHTTANGGGEIRAQVVKK